MNKRIRLVSLIIVTMSALSGCVPSYITLQEAEQARPRTRFLLDSGWVCQNIKKVQATGEELSTPGYSLTGWLPATVPGTVLTTMLNDKLVPDPFYGMNNKKIPDIFDTGADYYTYWFIKDFHETPPVAEDQVWLKLRGVNYGCDLYLNGHKLNKKTHYGMFLRQTYNITSFLSKDGNNRLAVIVYPPNPPGNGNGGQGGDGTIAHSVTNQYAAGWDWIRPIPDRNTGIWDRVEIVRTNAVYLKYPHLVTIVTGKRYPDEPQEPAIIKASVNVDNPTDRTLNGTVQYIIDSTIVRLRVDLKPRSSVKVQLPDFSMPNPRLWWPNGYGQQSLYNVDFQFVTDGGKVLDDKEITTGIRQIETKWDDHTKSRMVFVNGQKIFIRGGDWIDSDEMLRFSKERYNAEIRFQHEMGLNLLRVWGGGITERPDFYRECDKYGLLVMQEFWITGDCNGKWFDPMKKQNQWIRREYPDNHKLFLESVADQVRMLRNYPSLAFYLGGNEITPPIDILHAMQDSLMPDLDSTRYFFEYSNVDSMSYNFIGGNGDGPYHVEPVEYFWKHRSFPFNTEVGSVGMGDYRSLKRFIPPKDLVIPASNYAKLDSVWKYHEYLGYGNRIDRYGTPTTLRQFAKTAQIVNYNQYRGLIEGHLAHMWDWYTGVIIWKTENPWTALRGQMYDYYLDPNGGLYGLKHADKLLHVMYDPLDGMVTVANQTFRPYPDLMVQVRVITIGGKDSLLTQWFMDISPTTVQKLIPTEGILEHFFAAEGGFLDLRLLRNPDSVIDENLYWFPDSTGIYSGLQHMAEAYVNVSARKVAPGQIEVRIEDPPGAPLAFFNRISLLDTVTNKRVLPVFYSDNYVSVLPGEERTVYIDCGKPDHLVDAAVAISGWNVKKEIVEVR